MSSAIDISKVLAKGPGRTGINEGLGWDEYKALPAMNPSTIAHGMKSMLHLLSAWNATDTDSASKQWGRAIHTMILEPREFAGRYASWDGRRAGKAYEEFAADAWEHGKEVLKTEQMASLAEAGAHFVEECDRPGSDIKPLIEAGKAEVTVFSVEFGIQCRGRLDWISSQQVIVDVKSTKDVHKDKFWRDFFAFHYDLKLGLYQRWLQECTGKPYPVYILAIENHRPYDIALIPIPDAVLDQGARHGLAIIERLPECIKTGYFPGVANGELYELVVPAWCMEDEDEELVEYQE